MRLLLHGRRNRSYKVYYSIDDRTQMVQVFHVRHWARRTLSVDELAGAHKHGAPLTAPGRRAEGRVAADRRDCYWLYVVTDCKTEQPVLREPIRDPGRFHWHEITKIEHYRLNVEELDAHNS